MAPTRRLAAILAADVAGYSRLMGVDEESTHERHRHQDPDLSEDPLPPETASADDIEVPGEPFHSRLQVVVTGTGQVEPGSRRSRWKKAGAKPMAAPAKAAGGKPATGRLSQAGLRTAKRASGRTRPAHNELVQARVPHYR